MKKALRKAVAKIARGEKISKKQFAAYQLMEHKAEELHNNPTADLGPFAAPSIKGCLVFYLETQANREAEAEGEARPWLAAYQLLAR